MGCLLLRWYYDESSCMLGNKKKMAVTLTRPLIFFCLHLSLLSLKGHVPLSVNLGITSSHWTAAQAHKCMHLSVDKSLSVEMNYLAPTCYMLTLSHATGACHLRRQKTPPKRLWTFGRSFGRATLLLCQVCHEVFRSTVKLREVVHLNGFI